MDIPQIVSDKQLRIGVYGNPLRPGRAGVGHFTSELCSILGRYLPNATFFVYSQDPAELPTQYGKWVPRLETRPIFQKMKPVLWLKFGLGKMIREDDLDVFWATSTILPYSLGKIRTVSTICDLNYIVVPDTMSYGFLWANRLFFSGDVKRTGTALAISQGTSDRMLKHFGRRASLIVRPSVGDAFKPQDKEMVQAVLSKYRIDGPYLLGLSTWEPRKNFEMLVRTFLKLKKEGLLGNHKLVLAGGRGWKDNRLVSLIQGEGGSCILPLGYVPDEDLPPLYGGAEIFVFPSLYEGFGIPVLEALACGTRVVATDVPEIREAGGSEAVYIEPTEQGLREGILTTIASRRKVTPPSYDTWDKGARELARAICGQFETIPPGD